MYLEEKTSTKQRQKKYVYLTPADNENLPFEDNQFEVYISNFSLHIVHDHMKMLKEARRVGTKFHNIGA
jgi:ubiquinone/menaquinone biosynthesis C-methylase UbiE